MIFCMTHPWTLFINQDFILYFKLEKEEEIGIFELPMFGKINFLAHLSQCGNDLIEKVHIAELFKSKLMTRL